MTDMGKLLIIVLATLSIGMLSAPVAFAADEEGFLGYMSQHGATVTPFTRGFLLGGGNAACADIARGVPVGQVRVPYPGATDQALRDLAVGASLFLCPIGGQ
ncbi:DUF732 domain-containing protein [Mycobacterium adipatum]